MQQDLPLATEAEADLLGCLLGLSPVVLGVVARHDCGVAAVVV